MTSTCPCYCCPNFRKIGDQEMDLDAALHELSMLSTCTETRKQYIREQFRTAVSPGSFLIHLDSRFITKFSFSTGNPECSSNTSAEVEHSSTCSTGSEDSAGNGDGEPSERASSPVPLGRGWKMKTRRSNRHHICKPYEFPWRSNSKTISLLSVPNCVKDAVAAEAGSLPTGTISRQDSGNKSNPGSPVKNHELNSMAGCSILRSRSLDNLENAAFESKQPAESCHSVTGRIDVDSVSQRISNLHVS